MRHLTGIQIVETDPIVSALNHSKNEAFTRELSYLVLALVGFAALVSLLCMTGCAGNTGPGGGFEGRTAQSAAVVMSPITGNVREGATAVTGARVYLLEAAAGVSKSLLTETVEGATADQVGDTTQYGVSADALGQFAIRGAYGCDAGATVYLNAVKGTVTEMRALGVCPAASHWGGASGVTVDATSTVAARAELAGA